MTAPNSIVEIRKFQKITGNKEAKETQSKILLSIMHLYGQSKKKTQKLQGSVRHEL
ncbi:hypothetical protein ES288_D06G185500v1 [Gossypium darwinii]|uniref:Uncharacterized protein n=1 Tax=Gossypium darwinii TaxID=34276 RepID=A0A5D2C745_GOSDA|nr:hypothetical protein ES288_D06G185500v1 [Gossypium darwinii]